MNVLILCHSSTYAYGMTEQESHPRILEGLLRQSFPDVRSEVGVRGWGPFTPERRRQLMDEVARRPDYLLLDITYSWVNIPLVQAAVNERFPDGMGAAVESLSRHQYRFERWLLEANRPGLFRLYRDLYHVPFMSLCHQIVGSKPGYSVAEALDHLELSVRAARRFENMEILMLGPKPQALRPHWARHYPRYREKARDFLAGLKALCTRHHITFLDVTSVLDPNSVPGLLMLDDIHYTPKTHQLVAHAVHGAIVELERPYHRGLEPAS